VNDWCRDPYLRVITGQPGQRRVAHTGVFFQAPGPDVEAGRFFRTADADRQRGMLFEHVAQGSQAGEKGHGDLLKMPG